MTEPKISLAKGILTITLNLDEAVKTRRESESGKSLLLATASQVMDTEERDIKDNVLKAGIGNIRVALNVFQKNPAYMTETQMTALENKAKSEEAKAKRAELLKRYGVKPAVSG